jgi:hypothetical protein
MSPHAQPQTSNKEKNTFQATSNNSVTPETQETISIEVITIAYATHVRKQTHDMKLRNGVIDF